MYRSPELFCKVIFETRWWYLVKWLSQNQTVPSGGGIFTGPVMHSPSSGELGTAPVTQQLTPALCSPAGCCCCAAHLRRKQEAGACQHYSLLTQHREAAESWRLLGVSECPLQLAQGGVWDKKAEVIRWEVALLASKVRGLMSGLAEGPRFTGSWEMCSFKILVHSKRRLTSVPYKTTSFYFSSFTPKPFSPELPQTLTFSHNFPFSSVQPQVVSSPSFHPIVSALTKIHTSFLSWTNWIITHIKQIIT